MTDRPQFVDTNVETLLAEKRQQFFDLTGRTTIPGQVEDVLIRMATNEGNLQREAIQDAAEQNFILFAREPALVIHGARREVFRFEAQSARTTLRFVLLAAQAVPVTIEAGTRAQSQDGSFTFATAEELIIPAGELEGEVLALSSVASTTANGIAIGQISRLVDAVPFVTSVTNIDETADGAEREPLEDFRERVLTAPNRRAVGGPRELYRTRAKDASPLITDVDVQNYTVHGLDGVIRLFILTQSGVLSAEVMSLVNAAVNERFNRPTGDKVEILAAEGVGVPVVAAIQLDKGRTVEVVRPLIESALQTFALSLRSQLGVDLSASQVSAIIQAVDGVFSVDITSPNILTNISSSQFADLNIDTLNITVRADG